MSDSVHTLRTSLQRRRLLLAGAGAGLFAPAILGRGAAAADAGTVVVTDGGGAWGEAQRKAYYDPFEKETGIKVKTIPWAAGPRIKSGIEAGVSVGDAVDLAANQLARFVKAGLLRPIETKYFDAADLAALSPAPAHRYAIPALFGSVCIAYDKSVLGARKPEIWADFFDPRKFPGPRTIGSGQNPSLRTFEIAMMGDGVPIDKVYPIDFDRAFRALDRIRGSVVKFWAAPAEAGQLLVDKSVVMASAYNGRIADLKADGKPLEFTFRQSTLGLEYWVVPKNAENPENAFKLIAYTTRPDRAAAFGNLIDYSPTNSRAFGLMKPERIASMPTAAPNRTEQLLVNFDWWSEESNGVSREQAAAQLWERWIKS